MNQPNRTQLLYGLAALVLVLAFGEWVVTPIRSHQAELSASIQRAKKQLKETIGLEQTYIQSKALLSKDASAAATDNFTLFSFLEQTASRTGVRQDVESMRQSRDALSEGLDEESVEIRLTKVPLNKLVAFLYSIEKTPKGVLIKSLTLHPNATEGMDAELTVAAPAAKKTDR